jgi:hypothetical protein
VPWPPNPPRLEKGARFPSLERKENENLERRCYVILLRLIRRDERLHLQKQNQDFARRR